MKRTSAPDNAQLSILAALAFVLFASPTNAQKAISYRGICDASAAVPLDQDHFVVADDEHNTLQIYRRDLPDPVSAVPRVAVSRHRRRQGVRSGGISGRRIADLLDFVARDQQER